MVLACECLLLALYVLPFLDFWAKTYWAKTSSDADNPSADMQSTNSFFFYIICISSQSSPLHSRTFPVVVLRSMHTTFLTRQRYLSDRNK